MIDSSLSDIVFIQYMYVCLCGMCQSAVEVETLGSG